MCVFSILPFLFHCNFWVFYAADSMFQLFLYNLSLFIVGLVSLVMYVTSQGRKTTWKMPALCVMEVAVNYYNYCWDFYGWYCPKTDMISQDRRMGLVVVIFGTAGVCIASSLFIGRWLSKSKSKKQVKIHDKEE